MYRKDVMMIQTVSLVAVRSDGDAKGRHTTSLLIAALKFPIPADDAGHAVLGLDVKQVVLVRAGGEQGQSVLGQTQSDRRRVCLTAGCLVFHAPVAACVHNIRHVLEPTTFINTHSSAQKRAVVRTPAYNSASMQKFDIAHF